MGAPKLKIPKKKKSSASSQHDATKQQGPNSTEDKQVVNQFLNVINKKLRDPELAKKAALIIEKMINKK